MKEYMEPKVEKLNFAAEEITVDWLDTEQGTQEISGPDADEDF